MLELLKGELNRFCIVERQSDGELDELIWHTGGSWNSQRGYS